MDISRWHLASSMGTNQKGKERGKRGRRERREDKEKEEREGETNGGRKENEKRELGGGSQEPKGKSKKESLCFII